MTVDTERLKQWLPLAPPLVILAAGWLLLIAPASADSARTGRDLDALRQRAAQVRATLSEPAPQAPAGDPIAAFQRQVAASDATAALLEELARLASASRVNNLLIETGERVAVAADATAPRVAGAAQVDPRIQLFATPLAYSPVTMSFDADYAAIGNLLWRLRDLATIVEVRSLEIRSGTQPATGGPVAADAAVTADDGAIHAALTLFAYSRQAAPPAVAAGRPGAAAASGEGVLP